MEAILEQNIIVDADRILCQPRLSVVCERFLKSEYYWDEVWCSNSIEHRLQCFINEEYSSDTKYWGIAYNYLVEHYPDFTKIIKPGTT